MTQIHKKFTIDQVKVLLTAYREGHITRTEIENTLGIGKAADPYTGAQAVNVAPAKPAGITFAAPKKASAFVINATSFPASPSNVLPATG